MRKLLTAATLSVATLVAGCSMRITDFTVISTKNVNVKAAKAPSRVVGTDCIVVFLFPFGIPNMKTAIDKAIEQAGPQYDALIDGVVYIDNYHFIVGQQCYRVEGTPINTQADRAMLTPEQLASALKHS